MFFYIILFIFVVLPSVTTHEFFHGWIAYKLGDPTAKYAGRLSLNPLVHIDPMGTVIFPLLLLSLGLPAIGSAKPVPINYLNFKNPRRDIFLVSIAGPLSNFILALTLLLVLRILSVTIAKHVGLIFVYAVVLNIILSIFNSVPIPPLDGSRVVSVLLPSRYAQYYNRIEPVGIPIVFLLFFMLSRTSILSGLLSSLFSFVSKLL
jgi:Zn-dependent protease